MQVRILRFQLAQLKQRYDTTQDSVNQLIAKIKELRDQKDT